VQAIRTARDAGVFALGRRQILEESLVLLDRIGIEQLAELGLAEELAELRRVDRERVRFALGERRVAVVEEARDPGEEQRRGKSRARDAASRKRAANIEVPATDSMTMDSISSALGKNIAGSGGRSASGMRNAMPSSDHIESISMPLLSRSRAATAVAHGAWMRAPKGVSTLTR
jgi:hypothetical protein